MSINCIPRLYLTAANDQNRRKSLFTLVSRLTILKVRQGLTFFILHRHSQNSTPFIVSIWIIDHNYLKQYPISRASFRTKHVIEHHNDSKAPFLGFFYDLLSKPYSMSPITCTIKNSDFTITSSWAKFSRLASYLFSLEFLTFITGSFPRIFLPLTA